MSSPSNANQAILAKNGDVKQSASQEAKGNMENTVDYNIETKFEPMVCEVKWDVQDENKAKATKSKSLGLFQDAAGISSPDHIPVFQASRDIPQFEMNVINPDTQGSDSEEHEGWNSDEDEAEYQKDVFEDDEEEKANVSDQNAESDYEEDFESEEETNHTNHKSDISSSNHRSEYVVKKLEAAKKEKQLLDKLIQDRSATSIQNIGESAYQEIIGFLRAKIGVA